MTTWANKGAQQRAWPWPRPQRRCSPAVVVAASANSSSNSSSSRNASAVERMAAQIEQQYPDVRHMRPEEVIRRSQLQQDHQQAQLQLQLVDVRPRAERAVSTLPGAISLAELERRLQEEDQQQDQQQKLYVLYCTVGKRSSDAAQRLQARHGARGPSFSNLRGSMLAWAHAGLPLEGDDPKRVHCYARPWALLPDGYEATVYSPAQLLIQTVLPPNDDA
jgi:rhodanese-related sulfurtransferase